MSELASPSPASPWLKVFQFDSKQNICPVRMTVDHVNCELKIEKDLESEVVSCFKSLTSQASSLSSPAKRIRFEENCDENERVSKKCSPEPLLLAGINNLAPKPIPFEEIKELRCFDFHINTADSSILEKLNLENIDVGGARSQHKYKFKTGVLLFGKQFYLKKYAFLFVELEAANHQQDLSSREQWNRWIDGLITAEEYESMSYFRKLDLWYQNQFSCFDKERVTSILKWRHFLDRLHHRNSHQDAFQVSQQLESLLIRQDAFGRNISHFVSKQNNFLVHARHFLHSGESINRVFQSFQETRNVPGASNDSQFTIMMKTYIEYAKGKVDRWLPLQHVPELDLASASTKTSIRALAEAIKMQDANSFNFIDEKLLCSHYLLDYLYSDDNTIWNRNFTEQYQDMNRPLSHYWINTSHNTYLTGDQLTSESSIECYVRALRSGCRCIEIDVWNGADNKPIVTHGMTLTTSILLKDVLIAIRENAFVKTSFPLIISMENHCNIRQQQKMAKYFKKIFGNALVMVPLELDPSGAIKSLPSPNKLRNRVIIKGRSLPLDLFNARNPEESEVTQSPSTATGMLRSEESLNQSYCLIMDEMWKMDESGKWIPYIYVLTQTKLFCIEGSGNSRNLNLNKSVPPADPNEDYHRDQTWFHREVNKYGRSTADAEFHGVNTDGAFFVRKSVVDKNGYTLNFYANGKVHHCHIFTRMTIYNEKIYYLREKPEEDEIFYSLEELVDYYKNHPVNTRSCYLKHLGAPVPWKKRGHANDWYYNYVSRKEAEELLQKKAFDGAFLKYNCADNHGTVMISHARDSAQQHCIIRNDIALFFINALKPSRFPFERFSLLRSLDFILLRK